MHRIHALQIPFTFAPLKSISFFTPALILNKLERDTSRLQRGVLSAAREA